MRVKMVFSKQIASAGNTFLTHRPSDSEITIITFDHAGAKFREGEYWGKKFVEKFNLNCFAFTHKSRHWYPKDEVEALSNHITKDRPVLIYGGSMGGYAAIKFSKLLQADHVLAFSPQFSINPNDIGKNDTRFIADFNPNLHSEMAIKKNDTEGRIVVVYDPGVKEDVFNVEKIEACTPVKHIKIPFMGHDTSRILTNRDFSGALIQNIFLKKDNELNFLALKSRGSVHSYLANLAQACCKRKKHKWALNLANRSLAISPKYLLGHAVRAQSATNLKKWAEAEEACWKLVSLSPKKSKYWLMLAHVLTSQKKYDVANIVFAAAAEIEPTNIRIYDRWMSSLVSSGNLKGSEEKRIFLKKMIEKEEHRNNKNVSPFLLLSSSNYRECQTPDL
jgi:tetratricopeptide (TPR) repeat protein